MLDDSASAGAPPSFDAMVDESLTPHQRYRSSVVSGVQSGSPNQPAGVGAPEPTNFTTERISPSQLAAQWGQVGKGVAKGVPASLAGGMIGDIEQLARIPLGVSQKTYVPTTQEGGYLGPRGLGGMSPAANEEEALGMNVGSMIGPGAVLKLFRVMRGLPKVSPGEPPPPPSAPPGAPVATPRAKLGIDLLPPETPHKIPFSPTAEPAAEPAATPGLSASRNAGAAGTPGGPLADISQPTIDKMRQIMADQGFTPFTIDDRLEGMSAHQFFGEINPNLEAEMGATASVPGPAKLEVINSIQQRAKETSDRLKSMFNAAFGESQDVAQLRRSMDIDRTKAADPLYKKFKSLSIPPTQEMQDLIPRLQAVGALGEAKQVAAAKGIPWKENFITEGEMGNAVKQSYPTAESWDLVKQALDSKIENSFNARGEPTLWTRIYTGMKNELVNAIDNHPDPSIAGMWKQARDAWGGPASIKEKWRMGEKLLSNNVPADEVPFLTAAYSDGEMGALQTGLRRYLENKLGKPGQQESSVIKDILSPNNQSKIRWIIGDDKADSLFGAVQHEATMKDAPTRIYQGSPTQFRTEAAKRWTPQPGALDNLSIGNVVSGIAHPLSTAADVAAKAGLSSRNVRKAAEFAKLRDEASRIFTLQGPERDAVARWLVNQSLPQGLVK